jgi:hypothetical protein
MKYARGTAWTVEEKDPRRGKVACKYFIYGSSGGCYLVSYTENGWSGKEKRTREEVESWPEKKFDKIVLEEVDF